MQPSAARAALPDTLVRAIPARDQAKTADMTLPGDNSINADPLEQSFPSWVVVSASWTFAVARRTSEWPKHPKEISDFCELAKKGSWALAVYAAKYRYQAACPYLRICLSIAASSRAATYSCSPSWSVSSGNHYSISESGLSLACNLSDRHLSTAARYTAHCTVPECLSTISLRIFQFANFSDASMAQPG